VLSGRGLCDELITRPEESYRLCCVVVCDLETSRIGAPYIYDISRLRVKNNVLVFADGSVDLGHWCMASGIVVFNLPWHVYRIGEMSLTSSFLFSVS